MAARVTCAGPDQQSAGQATSVIQDSSREEMSLRLFMRVFTARLPIKEVKHGGVA